MFNRNESLINKVRVDRTELMVKVEQNLQKHIADISEAASLRRAEIADQFKAILSRLEKDENYQPRESLTFPALKDHSKDYVRALEMLRMTEDATIELEESQFDRLVMDNWEWKSELIQTASLYGKAI